jgi:Sulfotransferase family
MGRSGTTLLRLMLDAHSCLAIPAETGFVADVAALIPEGTNARAPLFALITQYKTWPDFGLESDECKAVLEKVKPFSVTEGVRAVYRAYAHGHGKSRFGDKTPRYTAKLHKVQAVLPEARFVHVIRDGRDVALSMRDVWFGRDASIEEHIGNWRGRIQKARVQARQCQWYMEVRYEDLVRTPETILRRICEFIELPYEDDMLFYFNRAASRLNEVSTRLNADGTVRVSKSERLFQHRFTSKPLLQTRMGRYQREMTGQQRQRCASIAGDLLAELGYET